VLVFCLSTLLLTNTAVSAGERRGPCDPDGTMRVTVELAPPAGKTLAGVKVALDYPEQAVKIPGFEDQPDVKARVKNTPAGFLASVNDLDDQLVVALVGTSGLPAGPIFTVELDRCKGAPKATRKDFRCKVEQASTDKGVLVDGATCVIRTGGAEVTKSKGRSR
jgi:hypothetical protein